jgi:hypothetical protein
MKHKQKFKLLLFFMAFNLLVVGQNKSNPFALTLDVMGGSGLYSFNGEYQVGNTNNLRFNAHLGFGYLPMGGPEFFAIPFGFNMLTGSKQHHLEIGLGASFIQGLRNVQILDGDFGTAQAHWELSHGLYLAPSIGYRFDKLNKGIILKVYYSPLINVYDFFDKTDYLEKLILTRYDETTTKEEYYNKTFGNADSYPIAKSKWGNFGVTIGYKF